MTRKNYIAIAEITKNILRGSTYLIPMVNTLADYFQRENDLFDKSKFRTACLNGELKKKVEDGGELSDADGEADMPYYRTESINQIDAGADKKIDRILLDHDKALIRMNTRNKSATNKIRKKNKN